MNSRIKEIKFVVTDPHFDHENLVKFARPKFKNAAECNELIVKNYKAKITNPNTVVLFMGDIGNKAAIERILPTLKGYKILILGNHDKYAKAFYAKYFDEVYDHPIFYHKRIVFSHEPIPVAPGTLNVHGHTHVISLNSINHWNICPELVNYEPIKIKDIEHRAFALEKECTKFLGEWYGNIQVDNATWDRVDLYLDKDNVIIADKTKILLELKNMMRKEMSKDDFRKVLKDFRDFMYEHPKMDNEKVLEKGRNIVKLELKKLEK